MKPTDLGPRPEAVARPPAVIDGWGLTEHARARAVEMGVTAQEIRGCLSPSAVQSRSRTYPGCMNRWHGRLALATDPATRTVITLLWNRPAPDSPRFDRADPPPRRSP